MIGLIPWPQTLFFTTYTALESHGTQFISTFGSSSRWSSSSVCWGWWGAGWRRFLFHTASCCPWCRTWAPFTFLTLKAKSTHTGSIYLYTWTILKILYNNIYHDSKAYIKNINCWLSPREAHEQNVFDNKVLRILWLNRHENKGTEYYIIWSFFISGNVHEILLESSD
jgi:hypothetical protein